MTSQFGGDAARLPGGRVVASQQARRRLPGPATCHVS
jgi:hypothetical protein